MKYSCIVVDPPWRYRDKLQMGVKHDGTPHKGHRGAESHYPCLSLPEIREIVFNQLDGCVADNAHLYLWTTNAFIAEAWQLAQDWGFTPRTILTWVKPQIGMGHYFRNNTEHVVFAVRGKLGPLRRNCPTAFVANRRKHSAKPDEFFSIVESITPGPRLELFARRPREGWDVWGNEV